MSKIAILTCLLGREGIYIRYIYLRRKIRHSDIAALIYHCNTQSTRTHWPDYTCICTARARTAINYSSCMSTGRHMITHWANRSSLWHNGRTTLTKVNELTANTYNAANQLYFREPGGGGHQDCSHRAGNTELGERPAFYSSTLKGPTCLVLP